MTEPMAYAGIDANGDCVAAVVDDGSKLMAKDVADFIKSGLTIQRVSCQWVRENFTTPKITPDDTEQGSLPI